MNSQRLGRATVIGILAQLAMVIVGHYVPLIKENFLYGGLALSLIAGVIYAARSHGSSGATLAGGTVAGGVCALIGIAVSCLLGDVPPPVLLFGTVGSAVAGALGALLARLFAPAVRAA